MKVRLTHSQHLESGHDQDASSQHADEPEVLHAPSQPAGATQYRCSPCNKIYVSEKALKQHLRDSVLHPSCQHCEEAFSDSEGLANHAASMHPDELAGASPTYPLSDTNTKHQFRCELCNRKYVSEKALVQHYRDSTRHPTCEHCDTSFPDLRAREAVRLLRNHPFYESHESKSACYRSS